MSKAVYLMVVIALWFITDHATATSDAWACSINKEAAHDWIASKVTEEFETHNFTCLCENGTGIVEYTVPINLGDCCGDDGLNVTEISIETEKIISYNTTDDDTNSTKKLTVKITTIFNSQTNTTKNSGGDSNCPGGIIALSSSTETAGDTPSSEGEGEVTATPAVAVATSPAPMNGSSCLEFLEGGFVWDGIYTITLSDDSMIDVYCDQQTDGGGWTVFQKRFDGSVDFVLFWDQYSNGFGNVTGEYWLGLENIYKIVQASDQEMRVELEDFSGNTAFAHYSFFKIGPSTDNYKLTNITYSSGTAGNSMLANDQMFFTTRGADNDLFLANCADFHPGGWWYSDCGNAWLNGVFNGTTITGIMWESFSASSSLKRSEMKLRPI